MNKKEYEKKIEENIKLVKEGKPLNMPLRFLNGDFKQRYRGSKITNEEFKKYMKKYIKKYYKKNKEEILRKMKEKRQRA